MRTIPENVSESTRRRNPHLYGTEAVALKATGTGAASVPEQSKRIRQESRPLLNKLETEFLRYSETVLGAKLIPQAIRFKLGNGIWFKPDFVRIRDYKWACYEVKGPHAFRGGFENLKVAAHQYPEIQWVLVWKEQGQWKQQIVMP